MGINQQITLQNKLRAIESTVNSAFSSGHYRLSVYLENFACNLFNLYYGYSFINLNEVKTNNEGVDIYNKEHNHGIQVTNETPNSEKIENTKRLSSCYKRVDVFFFTTSKAKKLNKKYGSKKYAIITLDDIINDATKEPTKCSGYISLIDTWFFESANIDADFVYSFNSYSNKQFNENVNSNKYNKNLYVEEPVLKNICRCMTLNGFLDEFFFENAKKYFENPSFRKLLNTKAKGDNEELLFKNEIEGYEIFLDNSSSSNPLLEQQVFSRYLNYLSKCYGWGVDKNYQVEDILSGKAIEHHDFYGNRVLLSMIDTNHYLNVKNKRISFIVRDACKGKTCFLSDLFETVLKPRSIPTLYINIKDVPNSLIDFIKDNITNIAGVHDFFSATALLKQYFRVSNKQIVLLLDGLNESSDLLKIKKEIVQICKYVQDNLKISLIMTIRPTVYDAYYKSANDASSYNDFVFISDDRTANLRDKDIHDDLLFNKYIEHYKANCFISHGVKQTLKENPLLLSLFCRLHENDHKSIVKSLMTKELFEKYFDDRGDKYVQSGVINYKGEYIQFAIEMAELMLSNGNIYQIAFSDIPESKRRILKHILDNDILFSENSGYDSVYSFTFDEIRDYCLSKYILKKPDFVSYLNSLPPSINEDTKIKIARFVFLELKESQDTKRYEEFKKFTNFKDVYGIYLLSLDSSLWDLDDIEKIKNSIFSFYGGTYENLAYRLVYDDKIPTAYSLVFAYLVMNQAERIEWEKIFLGEYHYYDSVSFFENTLFYKLLKMKSDYIEDNEIGALLWIGACLYHRLTKSPNQLDVTESLFEQIYRKHTQDYLKAVEMIKKERPEFSYTSFFEFDD